MPVIPVKTASPYEVTIAPGLLGRCGALTAAQHPLCRAVLVTEDGVPVLYPDAAEASFRTAGFEVSRIVFPQGEAHKTMETVTRLLEFFASVPLTREDLVIAVGGGIAGDVAGFAASCWLRGIPFVQIPTTLLAAVDASVGGKTAVNLTAGKNLAGAFHQPLAVFCDTDILSALPAGLLSCGAAECIKYGLLGDEALFSLLEQGKLSSHMEQVVSRCVEMKSGIVAADEQDNGCRQLLNLGHTLGHAAEKVSGFAISHGEGVAMGMVMITRAAQKRGLCSPDVLPRLAKALDACGLPVSCPYAENVLLELALRDKKRRGDRITLVIPTEVGKAKLHPIPVSELPGWIRDGLTP